MWTKGAFTTTHLVDELVERKGLTKGQAKCVVENFFNTINYIANETDAVGIKLFMFGTIYIREWRLKRFIASIKRKIKSHEGKPSQNKFKRLLETYNNKLEHFNKRDKSDKKLNDTTSLLQRILQGRRLNKEEVAKIQNKFANENNR